MELIACRSEEHTSELQSPQNLVCRLLLEKKTSEPAPTFRNMCRPTQAMLSRLLSVQGEVFEGKRRNPPARASEPKPAFLPASLTQQRLAPDTCLRPRTRLHPDRPEQR